MTIRLEDAIREPVSRETEEKLRQYAALISHWTARINLIAKSTADQIWTRHVIDCAQIFPYIPISARRLVDLGSGAGLPGLVLAILAQEKRPETNLTLIESDQRKATFMRTAVRELGIPATILIQRIEEAPPQVADVATSRALAPLERLIPLARRHLCPGGVCLFLKGAGWQDEVASLDRVPRYTATPSLTGDGTLLWISPNEVSP